MIGKNVLHYKIVEKLGEGGMGRVYLAEDTKLERKVAIKFLPEHLTKDKENVERFEREAKAAASLNHPNIVTIYEINEFEGQIFIVMEFVDGQSLRYPISEIRHPITDVGATGPVALTIEDTINYITQICQGLSKAHEAGIVHRDIKPENILIDKDGRVKILDFGLAKLKGVSKLTKETSTIGTIHYMSPEQIQGKEVDHRSDIWSLGVLFYEILTGEVPFQGEYEQAVTYAILNEEPKQLKEIESKYSPEISLIITKMLVKQIENRYQKCIEVSNDLKREINVKPKVKKRFGKRMYAIAGISVTAIILVLTILYFYPKQNNEVSLKSLAILPFINEKSDPERDFLGMSLPNQIIDGLNYLQNIIVRPFSSVRVYKNKNVDPSSVGSELNVDYTLAGAYYIIDNTIYLNIEIEDIDADTIVWRDKIEESTNDIAQLIDDVSAEIIDGLKIRFSSDERERMFTDVPKNSIAFDYYQLSLVKPTTTNGNLEAISLLEKSIEYDSTFAPAFNQLGMRIHNITSYNLSGIRKLIEAEIALERALELNPEMLGALGNLARIYIETGRLIEANNLVNIMLELNQNNAYSHFVRGYLYRYAGLLKEAKKEMELAVDLDPSDWRFRSLGITYYYLGEYEKALQSFDIDKGSWYALFYKGMTLLRIGNKDIAREYLQSVIKMDPESFSANLSIALQASIDEKYNKGLKVLKSIEQENPADSDTWFMISNAYALLGEKNGTLRTIRTAVENGFYIYPFLKKYPPFDFIRNEPDFQKILDKAKEKHEIYKNILLSE